MSPKALFAKSSVTLPQNDIPSVGVLFDIILLAEVHPRRKYHIKGGLFVENFVLFSFKILTQNFLVSMLHENTSWALWVHFCVRNIQPFIFWSVLNLNVAEIMKNLRENTSLNSRK